MLITVICICLFIGAMGKSAQFPLHVWLPDSMEGPTPISALIHAATMVTAGIFMVARMSPLFELSDTALNFVLVIGAITALFMGFLGIIQNDIKRVVAYSTLSQLGYMTVALGASAYSVAVFHLMTHAFFKALLFLAAGSVIIGMHHDQDIRNMGGLRKYMPITWITSLLGSLALIGTPLFAGFYSKDSIIEAVHASTCRARASPLRGGGRRVRHGVLFLPHVLPGLPRQGALPPQALPARRRPRTTTTATTARPHAARVALGGDGAAGAAGDPVGGDRLPDHPAHAVR
jgi:NADH:ubiquinone oxidoreductase subunit 5 (subunit L)/multisubunit Na+/H+ antiporter MnhA subunit